MTLTWEGAYATAYKIQSSTNGTTWTDLHSTTTGTGGTQTVNVSGTGRYLRMYGTARNSGWGYSLWEMAVYSGGGGTEEPEEPEEPGNWTEVWREDFTGGAGHLPAAPRTGCCAPAPPTPAARPTGAPARSRR